MGLGRNRDEKMQRPMIHSNGNVTLVLDSLILLNAPTNEHNLTILFNMYTELILFAVREQCNRSHFSCQIYTKYMTWLDLRMRLFIHSFTFDSANEWKMFDKKKHSMETSCLSERMKSACCCAVLLHCVPFEAITSNGPVWYGCTLSFWMCIEVDVTARH